MPSTLAVLCDFVTDKKAAPPSLVEAELYSINSEKEGGEEMWFRGSSYRGGRDGGSSSGSGSGSGDGGGEDN
eukprot:1299774-Pleurochrysis_carterae.AAC.3